MAKITLQYVSTYRTQHGKIVHYFRRPGSAKIRLPGQPGSIEFMTAYHAALGGQPAPVHAPSIKQIEPVSDRKSLRWLCQLYLNSTHFKALDDKTRKPRTSILNQLCELPISETVSKKMGEAPFEDLHSKAIRRILDRKAETPEAANNWLKSIRAVFKWANEQEHAAHNPAKNIAKTRVKTDGFHAWTIDEVAQFEDFYPIGTKPRLALALLLYTGCRRADVVAFGKQHIRDGWLTYTQDKNRRTNPVTLSLPVLPALAEIIAATPTGDLQFVVTESGSSYTNEGFGKQFRKWATRAGLPHCTPHGLRKAGAIRAAGAGVTANELMAMFGWRDIKQAELYTRAADQKTLASGGMEKLGNKPSAKVSHLAAHRPKR